MPSVIGSENLSFRYNGNEVLSDVSLDIEKGDYVGIVGPNGSGKTTFIRLVLGLLKPTKGKVAVFGENPVGFQAWHRVGYLQQKANSFNPHFPATVSEIVGLGLLAKQKFPRKVSKADQEVINEVLLLMDIADIRNTLIGELSGGQQQRVLIARAMVSGPELLILDEPTTALDPEGREKFFSTLKNLNEKRGLTIVMVTHDLGTIGQYATRLLYLDKRVVFFGGFDAFCVSHEMAQYFGEYSQHIICHRHD